MRIIHLIKEVNNEFQILIKWHKLLFLKHVYTAGFHIMINITQKKAKKKKRELITLLLTFFITQNKFPLDKCNLKQ